MKPGAFADWARAALIAGGLTSTLLGCASSHASPADAGVGVLDGDEITANDRAVIDYVTAACEAWTRCPTGVLNAEVPYLHGPTQCMREWGDLWIEEIRARLRRADMEIDHREHARCMAVFASGRCPAVRLQTDHWLSSQCWLGMAFRLRGPDLGERCGGDMCGVAGSCVGPAECRTCVATPEVGEPCGYGGPQCRPGTVCWGDRCAVLPTREVGEGERCGLTGEDVGVDHLCAPGLYCGEDEERSWIHRCRAVPMLGEPCDDGLCAPGTVCVPGEWSNVCSSGPLREGQLCDSDSHEDACDHVNGLVCGDGICVRAGRGLGEPCILSCDEGLGCSGRQRCEPLVPLPYDLPNGAPCERSDQCVSRWCDDQSEPRVCRPSETACE